MSIATKLDYTFNRVADSLGISTALFHLKKNCDLLSVDALSTDSEDIYHFSDGSALLVSHATLSTKAIQE